MISFVIWVNVTFIQSHPENLINFCYHKMISTPVPGDDDVSAGLFHEAFDDGATFPDDTTAQVVRAQ